MIKYVIRIIRSFNTPTLKTHDALQDQIKAYKILS